MKDLTEELASLFPLAGGRKRLRKLPTVAGEYVDVDGFVWTLTENNVWVDSSGFWADPKFNWLLADRKFIPFQKP